MISVTLTSWPLQNSLPHQFPGMLQEALVQLAFPWTSHLKVHCKYMSFNLEKQTLIQVRQVLSQISLCSLQRLISRHFHYNWIFEEIFFKQKKTKRRKNCPWWAWDDTWLTSIKPHFPTNYIFNNKYWRVYPINDVKLYSYFWSAYTVCKILLRLQW